MNGKQPKTWINLMQNEVRSTKMYQNGTDAAAAYGYDRFVKSMDDDYYNAFLRELMWDNVLPEMTTDEPNKTDA